MSAKNIRFASGEHRDFFLSMMAKSRHNDSYHRSFFYVMGIAPETRANIQQMFNFKEDCIEPDGMHGGWQTSGTVRVCRLAFNLWNGYTEPEQSNAFSPEDLFCCEFAPYFMEGIACPIGIKSKSKSLFLSSISSPPCFNIIRLLYCMDLWLLIKRCENADYKIFQCLLLEISYPQIIL